MPMPGSPLQCSGRMSNPGRNKQDTIGISGWNRSAPPGQTGPIRGVIFCGYPGERLPANFLSKGSSTGVRDTASGGVPGQSVPLRTVFPRGVSPPCQHYNHAHGNGNGGRKHLEAVVQKRLQIAGNGITHGVIQLPGTREMRTENRKTVLGAFSAPARTVENRLPKAAARKVARNSPLCRRIQSR